MVSRLKELVRRRIWEPLRLRKAEEQARAYTPEQRERVRTFARAAKLRLATARELRDTQGQITGLGVYREAARLALAGWAAARGSFDDDATPTAERCLALLEQERGAAPAAGSALDPLAALFSAEEPLTFDRMSDGERRSLHLQAERAISRLLNDYEVRTVGELRVQRVVRATFVTAFAVGLALAAIAAFSAVSMDQEERARQDAAAAPAKAKPARSRRK